MNPSDDRRKKERMRAVSSEKRESDALIDALREIGEEIVREPVPQHLLDILKQQQPSKDGEIGLDKAENRNRKPPSENG